MPSCTSMMISAVVFGTVFTVASGRICSSHFSRTRCAPIVIAPAAENRRMHADPVADVGIDSAELVGRCLHWCCRMRLCNVSMDNQDGEGPGKSSCAVLH